MPLVITLPSANHTTERGFCSALKGEFHRGGPADQRRPGQRHFAGPPFRVPMPAGEGFMGPGWAAVEGPLQLLSRRNHRGAPPAAARGPRIDRPERMVPCQSRRIPWAGRLSRASMPDAVAHLHSSGTPVRVTRGRGTGRLPRGPKSARPGSRPAASRRRDPVRSTCRRGPNIAASDRARARKTTATIRRDGPIIRRRGGVPPADRGPGRRRWHSGRRAAWPGT